MTLRTLASLIAKREGKRSQARIGDIREILKLITDISAEQAVAKAKGNAMGVLANETVKKIRRLVKKKKK